MTPRRLSRGAAGAALCVLVGGPLLTAAMGYAPPFVVNQNAYFVHGLALAGIGHLADDALTQSPDAFPVLSLLLSMMYRLSGPELMLLVHVLLNGVYLLGLAAIGVKLRPGLAQPPAMALFLGAVILIHSAGLNGTTLGPLSYQRSWLIGGLAGFNLLAGYFAQQNFGVLVILSIAAFLHGRRTLAILLIAIAASIHAVYLIGGGAITLAYLYLLLRRGESVRRTVVFGSLALGMVLPIAAYVALTFGTSDGDSLARTHELMATFRSPHHALPERWFWSGGGWIQREPAAKLAWIALSIWIVRRSPLAAILWIPSLVGLASIAAVTLSGSYSLAVAYPWRIFVLLVPLATGSILTVLAARLAAVLPGQAALRVGVIAGVAVLTAGLAVHGVQRSVRATQRRTARPEMRVAEFVARTATAEHLYLIPPLARAFQGFRLHSGARTWADWKSPPIKDVHFLAWYARLQRATRAYRGRSSALSGCASVAALMRQGGVTHVVTSSGPRPCPFLKPVFAAPPYRVYRGTTP